MPAIELNPAVSSLNTREYLATKRTVVATKQEVLIGGDCCFCVPNCDWDLPAIANLSNPTDSYTNDRKDFIIQIADNSTVTGTLIKVFPNGTETPYVITDNTYGDYFSLGTLKSNVWGFYLDWYKVANLLGFGKYKFNITVLNSSATETFNEDSVNFRLMPYSCDNAHRTVRLETEQSGYFEGGFDYTGIFYQITTIIGTNINVTARSTWSQQIRLWGRFFREGYNFTVDNIVIQGRGQEQVQAQTVRKYSLLIDTIENKVSYPVITDLLLSPNVKISDYNIENSSGLIESRRVTMTEIGDPIITTLNQNEFYDLKFLDWKQDNVHRYR